MINNGKMCLLCIFDANTYRASGYIIDSDGGKLRCAASMKVLGYHLDGRPTAQARVEAL